MTPNWTPFSVCATGEKPHAPRSMASILGIIDRLRTAAFAEIQAREAFTWAAGHFRASAPEGLCEEWIFLAREENKHLGWLLDRLEELGSTLGESANSRKVSDHLWHSFQRCQTAQEFAQFMCNAEKRGQVAGEKFFTALEKIDEKTALIFKKIAEEEATHVALVERYFPVLPNPPAPRAVESSS